MSYYVNLQYFSYIYKTKEKVCTQILFQNDDKDYARPYLTDGHIIYRIGASFSSEKRNIKRWLVQAPDG